MKSLWQHSASASHRGGVGAIRWIARISAIHSDATALASPPIRVRGSERTLRPGHSMFFTLAIVLVVLWLLGFSVFHVAGGLIHLLLLFAVISIVWHFIAGRRTAT